MRHLRSPSRHARIVASVAAAWVAFASASAHGQEVRGPTPYLSTSAFLRDLTARKPGAKPALRPPNDGRGVDFSRYGPSRFVDHVRATPLEIGLAAAAIGVVGVTDWKWGGARFHWAKEGFFGKNTHNGGMDKLGHAWTSYVLTEMLAERMAANTDGLSGAHLSAAIVAFGIMAGVETGDAYTRRYGFSRGSVADGAGVALALLRGAFPKLREVMDYRVTAKFGDDANSIPKVGGGRTVPAYNRQRYILAIKGSGFEGLKATPLRYAELQFAYDTRGFHSVERKLGIKPQRNFYVGVGLNLSELLFGEGPVPNFAPARDTELVWAVEHALRYVQVPYTAAYARRR
ncbi:MAG: DUF2279 domain-containing protein [Rhodoblastus sp.]|nr:MAG: DUF2279 domain-containing protein [Rhodoblastus sp.]